MSPTSLSPKNSGVKFNPWTDLVGDGIDGTNLPPVPNGEDIVIENSNSNATVTPSKSVSNSTSLPTVKQLSAPLQPLKPLAAPLKERLKRVKSEGFIELSENVKARAENIRQYSQGSNILP